MQHRSKRRIADQKRDSSYVAKAPLTTQIVRVDDEDQWLKNDAADERKAGDWQTGNNFNIVFGDYHQATLPNCRLPGIQCTFMSLTAIIYSSLAKDLSQSLTKEEMYNILRKGNSYYESNIKEILESHPEYFERHDGNQAVYIGINDIHLKHVKIFGKEVVIKTGESQIGIGRPGMSEHESEVPDIEKTLRTFLSSEQHMERTGVVICGPSSRAVMKKTDNNGCTKYFLFDSHAFDSQAAFDLENPLIGNNNAAFVKFDEVDHLIEAYKNLTSGQPDNEIQLEITEVLCEQTNKNGSIPDIDNYISGDDGELWEQLKTKFEEAKGIYFVF